MNNLFGLSGDAKSKLVARLASRTAAARPNAAVQTAPRLPAPALGDAEVKADLDLMRRAAGALGVENPYFQTHRAIAGARSTIGNREYDNFVSYNYLGLNGDRRVSDAAKAAIDRYGTSVSASRLVSGERPIHRALEEALADAHGAEDALAFVSGHATNVTVIGHLIGPEDAVVHDSLSHNSILQGAQLSGAQRVPFPHNDLVELDRILTRLRPTVKRVLLVIEGHYSMDGDVPDLPAIIEIVRRHRASLMVDEAHSLGVLGARGLGHCRTVRHRSHRGGCLDGHAQQDTFVLRRVYRRAAWADRLSALFGARVRLLGGSGPPSGGRGARGVANHAGGAGTGGQARRQRRFLPGGGQGGRAGHRAVDRRRDRAGDGGRLHPGGVDRRQGCGRWASRCSQSCSRPCRSVRPASVSSSPRSTTGHKFRASSPRQLRRWRGRRPTASARSSSPFASRRVREPLAWCGGR